MCYSRLDQGCSGVSFPLISCFQRDKRNTKTGRRYKKQGVLDISDTLITRTMKKPNLEKMASSHAMSGIDAMMDVHAPLSTALPIPVNVSTTRFPLIKDVMFRV